MTNEELDEARVKEGWRIVQDRPPTHVFFFGEVGRVVARLAREGWTPPEPVSDDVLAARALLKTQLSEVLHGEVDAGEFDHVPEVAAYLAGCTRGREEAKGLVEALEGFVRVAKEQGLNLGPLIADGEAALASAKRGG